jgi:hypothetical protein
MAPSRCFGRKCWPGPARRAVPRGRGRAVSRDRPAPFSCRLARHGPPRGLGGTALGRVASRRGAVTWGVPRLSQHSFLCGARGPWRLLKPPRPCAGCESAGGSSRYSRAVLATRDIPPGLSLLSGRESPPQEYTGKVDGTCHSERNEIGRWPSPEHGCYVYSATQVATPVVQKKPSEMVWFPLSSVDNTSNLYTVFGLRYCSGIVTLV